MQCNISSFCLVSIENAKIFFQTILKSCPRSLSRKAEITTKKTSNEARTEKITFSLRSGKYEEFEKYAFFISQRINRTEFLIQLRSAENFGANKISQLFKAFI